MSFMIDARVADAYRITDAIWDNPGRGRYRGMAEVEPIGPVLIAVTAAQKVPFAESRARLALELPGITRLRAVGDLAVPLGPIHAIVEDEPAGRSLAAWRAAGLSRAAVVAVGVAVADVLVAAHARGLALGGVRPELIYAEARGDGVVALTAIAPRAVGFFATGGALDAGNEPAFDDVYEPIDVAVGRRLPSAAADVFTLAAGLGTLIAGRHPFATGSWAVQVDAMTRVDGGWPGVDDPVLRVLETALTRDPAARPTAAALRDQIAACQ